VVGMLGLKMVMVLSYAVPRRALVISKVAGPIATPSAKIVVGKRQTSKARLTRKKNTFFIFTSNLSLCIEGEA
jgi:hypothetical protein